MKNKPFDLYTDEDLNKYRKAFVIATLRRASYRWPWRSIAANKARIGWGLYQCDKCSGILLSSEKKLDHIEPVVDTKKGFNGFDDYITRLLCHNKGIQVLCWVCHENKTENENEQRKARRKARRRQGST